MKSGSLVAPLIAHTCTGQSFAWHPDTRNEQQQRELAWLLEAGLGPWLEHVSMDQHITVPPPWCDSLTSADLTARVLHAGRVDTAIDVIDACEACGCRPVLLKGISTSLQLWPQEYLRPMGDIDILVPASHLADVEHRLLERGLERTDHPDVQGMHHGTPLFHPGRQTFVELHRALVPRDSPFAPGDSLTAEQAWAHAMPAAFHGRDALTLRPEFQLVYVASTWFGDMIQRGVEPSYLPSLFDAAWLMRRFAPAMDWDMVLRLLCNPFVRGAVHVLLAYLPRFGAAMAPAGVRKAIAAGPKHDGAVRTAAISWMLDRYLVGARRWRHAAPPPVLGRYSPSYQFRKRVLSRWRRAVPTDRE